MLGRILVATDLSAASQEVVSCLAPLRRLGVSECILLQCVTPAEMIGEAFTYSPENLLTSLEEQKCILEEQGFRVTVEIVPGSPRREINRVAVERDCSAIVVGSHGHSLRHDLLGGVASAVLKRAARPVILIRLSTEPLCPVAFDPLAHALFPTDFSETAEGAFRLVIDLAESGARKITLLHVRDIRERETEPEEASQRRLAALANRLPAHGGLEVATIVRTGIPSREIVHFARRAGSTFIVMGSQGKGLVSEVFLGSVSHDVSRSADAPVMLVPASAEARGLAPQAEPALEGLGRA